MAAQTIQIPRMIARLTPNARQRHRRLLDLAYSANLIELYHALTSVEELDKINVGIRYRAFMEVLMGDLYAPRNSSMRTHATRNYTKGVPNEEIYAECYMAWLPMRDIHKPIIYSDEQAIKGKFILRPGAAVWVSGCYNKKIKNGDEIKLIASNHADLTLPVEIETENPSIYYKIGRRLSEDLVIRMHNADVRTFLFNEALAQPQPGQIIRIREAYRIAELAPYAYGQVPEPQQSAQTRPARPTQHPRHLKRGRTHR